MHDFTHHSPDNNEVYVDPIFNAPHWIVDDEDLKNPAAKEARLNAALDFLNNISLTVNDKPDESRDRPSKKSFFLKFKQPKNSSIQRRCVISCFFVIFQA